jgi:hypothetical protein
MALFFRAAVEDVNGVMDWRSQATGILFIEHGSICVRDAAIPKAPDTNGMADAASKSARAGMTLLTFFRM